MGQLVTFAALLAGCGLAGCGFRSSVLDGCPGFLDLCDEAEPTMAFEVGGVQSLNTDNDARCRTFHQASGERDVCLVYATSAAIRVPAVLTVTGSRPLAIASASTLILEGTVDVASYGTQRGPGSDDGRCSFASVPGGDRGGGGGGAGGSFTQPGGDGGTGDHNSNGDPPGVAPPGVHGPTTAIHALRGGCPGQQGGNSNYPGANGGRGGHAGGALYLFARQGAAISGTVRATGARGDGGAGLAGGGGGGTGGLVVIESPVIMFSGRISANGGGGGQGGGVVNGITPVSGNPGADGAMEPTAAAGGSGAANDRPDFGRGGAGGTMSPAGTGSTADFAGGGGGGAAGVILLRGQSQVSGVLSPAPQ